MANHLWYGCHRSYFIQWQARHGHFPEFPSLGVLHPVTLLAELPMQLQASHCLVAKGMESEMGNCDYTKLILKLVFFVFCFFFFNTYAYAEVETGIRLGNCFKLAQNQLV